MSTLTGPSVVTLVETGLDRIGQAKRRADARRDRGQLTPAQWARQLAVLHARAACWWTVLHRAIVADRTVPLVYLRAVAAATNDAHAQALHWCRTAAEYTADDPAARVA